MHFYTLFVLYRTIELWRGMWILLLFLGNMKQRSWCASSPPPAPATKVIGEEDQEQSFVLSEAIKVGWCDFRWLSCHVHWVGYFLKVDENDIIETFMSTKNHRSDKYLLLFIWTSMFEEFVL